MDDEPPIIYYASLVASVPFALAWWLYIDAAVVQSAENLSPDVLASHVVPGLVATLGLIVGALVPTGGAFSRNTSMARCCTFLSFVISLAAIVAALGLYTSYYSKDASSWPGMAIIIQTTAIFFSSALLLFKKLSTSSIFTEDDF